jgi:hypothetical protein
MFDFVRRWSKERGNRVFHLGGGSGSREDSLFHFKAGFSPLRAEFQSVRVIFDQERYQALALRAQGIPSATDYFPAYRAGPTV